MFKDQEREQWLVIILIIIYLRNSHGCVYVRARYAVDPGSKKNVESLQ